MNILNLLVTDHTFRTVALGCSLLGMVSGILGCFAVLRKQSLLGDAVSHASLPGVCLAFLFTNVKNTEVLLLGALISGIICIGLIQLIQNYTKIKFDSALALILSVFFGLGLVLLSYMNKLPGANKSGLNKFIFGQASTFVKRDVDIIFITGIVLLAIIIIFWKEFKIVSFDSDFAKTLGFPSKKIEILISVLIVTTVIIGIQAAGVILMIISPAVAARQWTDKLSIMVILAAIFGGISGLLGTLISISESDLPTGPVIVIIISVIVVISILFSNKRGIIFKIIRNQKRKKEFRKKLENKKMKLKSLEVNNLERGK